MRKLLLALSLILAGLAHADSTVELWRTHTLTFVTSTVAADPFATYLLKIRLTRPDASTISVEGFYADTDGAAPYTWRVRIQPDQVGAWSWTTILGDGTASWTTVNDGACSAGACSGTFTVEDVGDPGPLVRASSPTPHFEWGGSGEPVYPIGVFLDEGAIASCSGLTCFPRFSHVYASEEITGSTLRDAMRTRHASVWNANKVNIYYANNGDYGDISSSPWTSGESATPTATTPLSVPFFDAMDGYLKDWKASGQLAFMWFFADDSSNYGNATQAAQERLIRYAMARHSAYSHTVFVLALETNETGQITTARAAALGAYAETKNPWGRLLSSHQMQSFGISGTTIGCTVILNGEPWMDFWASQVGNTATNDQVFTCGTTIFNSFGSLPHDSEEFYLTPGSPTGQEAQGRERLWAAFLSGAGSGTGTDTANLQAFLLASRVPFHRMTPDAAIVSGGSTSGFARRETGHHFLVYKRTTSTSVTVTTAGSGLLGYWWDPADNTSPALSASFSVTAGTSAYTPPSNPSGQWALWITDGSNLLANVRLHPDPETDTTTVQAFHVRPDGSDARLCVGGASAGQPCTTGGGECGGAPAVCLGVCTGLGNAAYDGSGTSESCAKKTIAEAELLAGCGSEIRVHAGSTFESNAGVAVSMTDSCSADQPKRIIGDGLTTVVYQNMVGPLTCTPLAGASRTYACPRPATGITSVAAAADAHCFLQQLPAGVHVDIEPKSGRQQALFDGWCMTPTDNGGTPILTSGGNAALDSASVAGFWTYDSANNRYLIHPYALNTDGTLPAGTQFYAPTQTTSGALFDLAGKYVSVEDMRVFGAGRYAITMGTSADGNTVDGLDVIGSGIQAWNSSDNTNPSNPDSTFFWPKNYRILGTRFRNMNRRDKSEGRGMLGDPLSTNSLWSEITSCRFGGTNGLIDGEGVGECYSACNNVKVAGQGTTVRRFKAHGGHNHNFDLGTLLGGLIENVVEYNSQEGPFIAALVKDTVFRQNTLVGAVTYNGSYNSDSTVGGLGGMVNVQWRNNAVEKFLYNAPYSQCQAGYLCQATCDSDGPNYCDSAPGTTSSPVVACNCSCPGGTSCTWTDPRAPDPSTPSSHRNIDESNTLFWRDNSDPAGFFRHRHSNSSFQTFAPYVGWSADPCTNCERGTGSVWVDGATLAKFVNPSGIDLPSNQADYHLVAGSPAINLGATAYGTAIDMDGISRGGNPDAGAYEYTSTTCGNNIVEPGETCDCSDGSSCNGTTCVNLGFTGGVIGCSGWGTPTGCGSFDTTNCTGDTTQPAAIGDLLATPISATSCRLTFTTTGNNGNAGSFGGGGSIDCRQRLASDGGIDSTADDGTTADADFAVAATNTGEPLPIANTPQTFDVPGLTAGVVWHFACKITDPVGNVSAISNNPVTCTPILVSDVTAPSAIANLAVTPLGPTSARATWNDRGDDGASGDFPPGSLSELRVRTNAAGCITGDLVTGTFNLASVVPGVLPPTTAGAARSQVIAGLTANTAYCAAVKECDEAGNCSLSNVATFTTPNTAALTSPENLTGAEIEGGSIE
jgi:hypothetical protein